MDLVGGPLAFEPAEGDPVHVHAVFAVVDDAVIK